MNRLYDKHREYAPIAKSKNVDVRKRNRDDKPIDLRSEPMLLVTRASYQRRSIATFHARARARAK